MSEELLEELKKNPHFKALPDILTQEGVDQDAFMLAFRDRLSSLLAEHADDNEGLKEESHHYILPAIAVYRTLQETTPNALLLFREMWLEGAKMGASYLQKKAEDNAFLQDWIPSVTPKQTETGAFCPCSSGLSMW